MGDNPLSTRRHVQKQSLVALLVGRGLFDSEDEARRWVMAGQVVVNGQRVDKPGTLVPATAALTVRGRRQYVSRGGYKLAAALDYFGVSVQGRVTLDCGASTGGFTDCLVRRGAALVYAVDVGYEQLVGSLRSDPHVYTLERTNLSDSKLAILDPQPTLVTLDLSYLSLTEALPVAANLLSVPGEILALFKPLFEVEDTEARRTGRVNDVQVLVGALRRVLESGRGVGLVPLGLTKLALRPRHGVMEFFLHFSTEVKLGAWSYDDTVLRGIVAGQGIGQIEEDRL